MALITGSRVIIQAKNMLFMLLNPSLIQLKISLKTQVLRALQSPRCLFYSCTANLPPQRSSYIPWDKQVHWIHTYTTHMLTLVHLSSR